MRDTVVMALIVATMLFLPASGLLALVAFLVSDVSPRSFVTFGDALSAPIGLVAWWALTLIPSSVYAVIMRHEDLTEG
jgi:hypothetical protein